MPKVSVIIPFYNVKAELLERCVNSVLSQKMQDFELIIVDDGSEDSFKSVLEKLQSMDERIIVLSQVNQGCSSARNLGTKASSGDFVTYVDADDVVLPDFLSEALKIQTKLDADFVIGGNCSMRKWKDDFCPCDIDNIKLMSEEEKEKFKDNILLLHYFPSQNGFFGRGPVARLLRKGIAAQTFFDPQLVIGEDLVWNLELLQKCKKVCAVETVWYLYYEHPDSATKKFNSKIIEHLELELQEISKCMNLRTKSHLIAFSNRIAEDLTKIYTSYLGRSECTLGKAEKCSVIKMLYSEQPWRILGDIKLLLLSNVPLKLRLKCVIYRCRLYFICLFVKGIIKMV